MSYKRVFGTLAAYQKGLIEVSDAMHEYREPKSVWVDVAAKRPGLVSAENAT